MMCQKTLRPLDTEIGDIDSLKKKETVTKSYCVSIERTWRSLHAKEILDNDVSTILWVNVCWELKK